MELMETITIESPSSTVIEDLETVGPKTVNAFTEQRLQRMYDCPMSKMIRAHYESPEYLDISRQMHEQHPNAPKAELLRITERELLHSRSMYHKELKIVDAALMARFGSTSRF